MDTQKRQQERPVTAATETKTEVQRQRAQAQEEQLEAQERGDTKSELKEFAKEVIDVGAALSSTSPRPAAKT